MTWKQLNKAAGYDHKIGCYLLMCEENANDTIYVEKARKEEEFEQICLDTLSDHLSYESDIEITNWFANQGIKW